MIEEIKKIKSRKRDIRNFLFTIGSVFLIIAGILFWKEKTSYQLVAVIGFFLLSSGIVMPKVFKPVYLIWMIFALAIGWVMTRLILGLLYFLIITPIGAIPRLFGKQFLELKWDPSKRSYWNVRDSKDLKKRHYEKQF